MLRIDLARAGCRVHGARSVMLTVSMYAVSGLLSCASLAVAATANAADVTDGSMLDEVVVTAQKRSQPLLDVPMSITAIEGVTLERAGVASFDDYAVKAPNVSFSYGGDQGVTVSRTIAIRGITGLDTTGFYLNDMPLPAGVDPHAIDLSRIEVLRGPQGTLYGARSMGGTIRLITAEPDPAGWSGFAHGLASATHRGDGNYEVGAGANVPIADNLAGRVAAFSLSEGGFETRRFPVTGGPSLFGSVKNVATLDQYGASASLLWKPVDFLSVEPLIIYQHAHRDGLPLGDYTASNQVQERSFDIAEETEEEWTVSGLTINARLPVGTLTSATSYFNRRVFELEDISEWTASVFGYSPALPSAIPTWLPTRISPRKCALHLTFRGPCRPSSVCTTGTATMCSGKIGRFQDSPR